MAWQEQLVQRLKVALDKVTVARARLIAAIKSPWWARPRWMTHLVGPLVTVIVMADTLSHPHKLTLFSLHPLVMAIAFVALMPEGVVAYRNTLLLDTLSPIMEHGTKAKKRTIHMALQVLATIFAALGFVFVMGNKLYSHKSILPHTTHGVLGILTLLAMGLQVAVGRLKYMSFTTGVVDARNRGKKYRWHGKMGLLLYDLGTFTFVLGLWAYFERLATTAALTLLVTYGWLNTNLQLHETKHLTVPAYAEETDADQTDPATTAAETQQLTEDGGVMESKGERAYPE